MPVASSLKIPMLSGHCIVDVPELSGSDLGGMRSGNDRHGFIRDALYALDQDCVVRFRVGQNASTASAAESTALAITEALAAALRAKGAPDDMYVEVDLEQVTAVPDGFESRTLLPHHDAAHSSYLTPSSLDYAAFDNRLRRFSDSGNTSGATHKMYQGILFTDPGEEEGITAYYPLVPIVTAALQRQERMRALPDLATVISFLARNVADAVMAKGHRRARYLTLAAMLGSKDELFNVVAPHAAEADFPQEAYDRFDALAKLVAGCPCGECRGPQGRVFCWALNAVLGMTWPEFHERYGVGVPADRYDFVIGNNLGLIHAGIGGSRSRLLKPICLVVDRPGGPAYEQWLARTWRARPLASHLALDWPSLS